MHQRARGGWRFLTRLIRNITQHHTLLMASGVAFSCVLGLIPAMIAVVAVYGLVATPSDVESQMAPLTNALPDEAAELIVAQLENVTSISASKVTIGLAIGLFGVSWAVSNAINALVMAIRVAHEMPSPHTWIQGRICALKLTFVAVLATATSIWLVVALPEVLDRANLAGITDLIIQVIRWPVVIATSAFSMALLYRAVVGYRTGRYRYISIGAITGTAIWVASTAGLSIVYGYIGRVDSTFGSLGAVAALMVWLYLSAVAALIGAEIDSLRHHDADPPPVADLF